MDQRVVSLLMDLVAIPSVNPAYDPASPGEIDMSRYIGQWARQIGLTVDRQPVFENRSNVIVRMQVHDDLPTLLFESHMDTVGISPGTPAGFQPTIVGDAVFGRGTCDTKGSMAAMMAAFERLVGHRDALTCNLEFLAAVDEETIGSGSLAYARSRPGVTAAIVGEPTENRIVNGHKGTIRGEISVRGKAAHTSVAHEGVNAIDAMADLVVALREISTRLDATSGAGSLTVSLINGGTGINIVPDSCTIAYDRRTVPGDTSTTVLAEIDAIVARIRSARPDVEISRDAPFLDVSPLDTSGDAPIVSAASEAAMKIGLDPSPTMVPYGSDASYLKDEAGISCIVFGPGSIAHAHSATEHVPIGELLDAVGFYVETALGFGSHER